MGNFEGGICAGFGRMIFRNGGECVGTFVAGSFINGTHTSGEFVIDGTFTNVISDGTGTINMSSANWKKYMNRAIDGSDIRYVSRFKH